MGVDCRITIPAPAQLRDVAHVLAGLLGCQLIRKDLGTNDGATYCHVDGIRYCQHTSPSGIDLNLPECVRIEIDTPDGRRHFLYHFEWDAMGNHGIMPRSTASNIALAVGLVDFFGGVVDFNDADSIDEDYREPVREDIHIEDGPGWQSFQDRKLAVKPLTNAHIAEYFAVSAYGD